MPRHPDPDVYDDAAAASAAAAAAAAADYHDDDARGSYSSQHHFLFFILMLRARVEQYLRGPLTSRTFAPSRRRRLMRLLCRKARPCMQSIHTTIFIN